MMTPAEYQLHVDDAINAMGSGAGANERFRMALYSHGLALGEVRADGYGYPGGWALQAPAAVAGAEAAWREPRFIVVRECATCRNVKAGTIFSSDRRCNRFRAGRHPMLAFKVIADPKRCGPTLWGWEPR
jgi:hypothetical protein